MIILKQNSIETGISIKDYVLPTPRDGFIYLVMDKLYPQFIKVGVSRNLDKRLLAYNTDRPYPSVYLYAISKYFKDVKTVESKILDFMYNLTNPTTYKREWFDIEHKETLIKLITEAESKYD